jgi:hypothetical protein
MHSKNTTPMIMHNTQLCALQSTTAGLVAAAAAAKRGCEKIAAL